MPQNLALIVAGKISSGTQSLLRVVQEQVEPSLIAHNQNKGSRPPGWKRPFMETPSAQRKPIAATTKDTVEFPEKDESTCMRFILGFVTHNILSAGMGELIIGFLGPAPNDYLARKALDIIGTYLTSSAVAPLNKEYIEIESPLW